MSQDLYEQDRIREVLKHHADLRIYSHAWEHHRRDPARGIKDHFQVETLKGYGMHEKTQALVAASVLLDYLRYTQKDKVGHVRALRSYSHRDHVALDESTMINLELFTTLRDRKKTGTLVDVIDETRTALGGRLLRDWVYRPLRDFEKVEKRLDSVDEFVRDRQRRRTVRELLDEVYDIERILARLSVGLAAPPELINLKQSLIRAQKLKAVVEEPESMLIKDSLDRIGPEIGEVIEIIEARVTNDLPFDVKSGGIIRSGIDTEPDELREKASGYYIEVSNSNLDQVPDEYIRKQTLVNSERFITPDLKEYEDIVLTAEESIKELEPALLEQVVDDVLDRVDTHARFPR